MRPINCFLFCTNVLETQNVVEQLRTQPTVNKVFVLVKEDSISIDGCEKILIQDINTTSTIAKIAEKSSTKYSLIYIKNSALDFGQYALDRFLQVAEDTQAGMVYSDYQEVRDGKLSTHPTIDYQIGALRDDFNFGPVLLYQSESIKNAVKNTVQEYSYAAWYNLRLKVSQKFDIVHINEYLYTELETDMRKSGEKQFDYVDPRNRAVQIEMEDACTDHLKTIGAYLPPRFNSIDFSQSQFAIEASVIIPVKNRMKTIVDAIRSVLIQKTTFSFNLIIIDNHSTDGTSELINNQSKKDSRIIHIIPNRNDLGIGGCWNIGVDSPNCGKFAVQLDSDDVYENENTLQKIVDTFYEQQCAMVIGSYTMTNFEMKPIAPGLIDHKEWTPFNGRNNALRINGLGAPRAFFTPLLRQIKVPNTSYGEDYALGLRISREYQIGRIYESIYFCRRWEDNTDASLDVLKLNQHNLYKDKIRSIELKARIDLAKSL